MPLVALERSRDGELRRVMRRKPDAHHLGDGLAVMQQILLAPADDDPAHAEAGGEVGFRQSVERDDGQLVRK